MAVDPIAELKALRDHVVALNTELSDRGFTMAKDTKMRLDDANALIARADDPDGGTGAAWASEATALCALLRHEAGKVD